MSDRGITGLYEWFDRVGLAAERGAIHPEFPDVTFHDFESWEKTHIFNSADCCRSDA